ncbi:hypothetical protein [Streptosporangium canum]|uniref:hypothetical protein n=1 Tax=Streptosporangium canum TaxID=324952 RepID=UPI0037A02795
MTEDESGKGRRLRGTDHEALANLLGTLNEFLRSRNLGVLALLTRFMEQQGHPPPEFAACNLIDELSFIARR